MKSNKTSTILWSKTKKPKRQKDIYEDERQPSAKKRKQIEELEFDIPDSATNIHIGPSIISRIKKGMRRVYYPIVGPSGYLALSATSITNPFRRTLSRAYELDYGIRVLRFAAGGLQYSKKVSFADGSLRRYTFGIGNYIRFSRSGAPGPTPGDNDDGNGFNIGRIDYIFAYEQKKYDERRIFLVLTKVKPTDRIDTALELPLVEETGETLIIGLPAVLTDKIYIIDVSKFDDRGGQHQRKLVWVNWDIIWM
ncbi:hypothetical protein B0T20DRAFT_388399 [Sordaria brevicollis]|uniref:Uncharacterized protein n=1 Tax=Sordaria brevicollis TaxID=83679 RepID=A0AAE0PMF8_SORBR|nr:hypothetical protein B0T20DRAFT_388399 [Sordaria brevicollis]